MDRDESRQRILSDSARPSALAPFHVRNYRFQWPADLLTSWAFEMETLILGCTEMQGYLFSPAIPAADVRRLLLSHRARAMSAA